jgi:hypothetical protein
MHLLSDSEILPTLSQFIEPSNIPKKYGGTLDYKFGDLPNVDTEMLEGFTWAEGVTELPIGPIMWEEDDGAEGGGTRGMRMVAVGSVDGVKRRQVLGVLNRPYKEVFYPTA